MPRLSVNTALFKDKMVFEAYTPPPGPVDATLNVKRVLASTKSAEPLEYMAPENNVGCVNINTDV